MRLIDADALIEVIKKYKFGAISNESEREYTREIMLCFVNGSSTAYSVEKVVAELEERRAKNDCRVCRHFQNGKDECMEDCTDALIDDLLDIVRKGGVE